MVKKLQEWTKKHNWPVTTALWRPPQAMARTQFPITLLICPSAVLLPFIADERSLLYSADSMHGIGWGEETVRILEPRPNCPSPPYPQPHTWPKSDASEKHYFSQKISLKGKYQCHNDKCRLPDSANVWRPPAATATIFTPVLNVTTQGGAERLSSLDVELSGPCFAEDNLRRFELSSVPLLSEGPDAAPLLVLDTCDLGLTVMEFPLLYL
jgi:hypothetical protein